MLPYTFCTIYYFVLRKQIVEDRIFKKESVVETGN